VRGLIKQYANGVFTPEVVSILEDAFQDAWRRVQASKAPDANEEYASAGRAILATYIISACCTAYVCFWHKADISVVVSDVRFRG
jgi:hypothetical protein